MRINRHNCMQALRGTGVALVTPFKDGQIDYPALAALIEHCIGGGLNYLVSMGTTGESVTLSKAEKTALLEFTKQQVAGRVPLVLGLGGNHTWALKAELESLDPAGLAAILSVSPYYNKPTQGGIIRHYELLAEASPLPILLYNVPGRTSSNLLPETTMELAQHERIIGIKEASGSVLQCMELVRRRPEGFLLISGDDHLTLPLMALGFDGVISVIANAFPQPFAEMVGLAAQSLMPAAQKLHYKLLPLMDLLFVEGNPAGIKATLQALGLASAETREPLLPMSAANYAKVESAVKNLA